MGATSLTAFPQGGDAIMSRCLWRLGFPITDMGYTQYGRCVDDDASPRLSPSPGAPAELF